MRVRECPWTVYSEMGHLYYNYPKAQELASRREQKKHRSLRSGKTRVNQNLRDVADPLHAGIHSSLCLHKTGPVRFLPQRWKGFMEPLAEDSWKANCFWNRKSQVWFFKVCPLVGQIHYGWGPCTQEYMGKINWTQQAPFKGGQTWSRGYFAGVIGRMGDKHQNNFYEILKGLLRIFLKKNRVAIIIIVQVSE